MEEKRLKAVLETQATSYDYGATMEFITDQCEKLGGVVEWDKHDNIYVTKGDASIFPCVVSHTDTVHEIYKSYKVMKANGNYFGFDGYTMKQVGCGGDDKVGIWICLEALRKFDNIKVCFFAQEEIGCIGSSKADHEFFDDVGYVFECDRKGNKDFVQESSGVKMFGKKFKKAIRPILDNYNYEITTGGLTDVHEISQIADVACANMSCGYYNPHSDKEYVNIIDAIRTKDLVLDLIEHLGEVRYKHKATHTYQGYSYYGGYTSYGSGWSANGWSKPKPTPPKRFTQKYCPDCMSFYDADEGVCDWCTPVVDTAPEIPYVPKDDPCTCGGTYSTYEDETGKFKSCRDCGDYVDLGNEVPF
tara:strand:+ start:5063 stop:6142 length:1080 start_codon:yes stop_codon:yes gene_type:complete